MALLQRSLAQPIWLWRHSQGYPTTEPYPTQQYPPPQQQQYGYPQGVQPLGYSAPIAMQPTQVQTVRVNLP